MDAECEKSGINILRKLTLTLQLEDKALSEMAVQNGWVTKDQKMGVPGLVANPATADSGSP